MLACLNGIYNVTFQGAPATMRQHGVVSRETAACLLRSVPRWNFYQVRHNKTHVEYYSDIPLLFYRNTCIPHYVTIKCNYLFNGCIAMIEPDRERQITPQLPLIKRIGYTLPNFRHFSLNRMQEQFNVTDQMRYDASLVTLALLLYIWKREVRASRKAL